MDTNGSSCADISMNHDAQGGHQGISNVRQMVLGKEQRNPTGGDYNCLRVHNCLFFLYYIYSIAQRSGKAEYTLSLVTYFFE